MQQVNHQPLLPTRAFVRATIGILTGELATWAGNEPTPEQLQRVTDELKYALQQLEKRKNRGNLDNRDI